MNISITLPETLRSEDEIIATWKGDIRKPVVSIRCITYNHAAYIEDAIKGFLIQKTDFPIEIWIHDDASTDGTRKVIEHYQKRHPRIINTILQDENQYSQGVKPGRLLAEKCIGEYVALCEGDDHWINCEKLAIQVKFLQRNPDYAMCFHNAWMINEGEENSGTVFSGVQTREYSGEEILKKWIIPTASVVYRANSYTTVSHPDFMFGDVILFLSLAEKGRLWGLDETMSIYRRHAGGLTASGNRSISFLVRFIKHHEPIADSFNRKYAAVESEMLSSAYIGLSKRQIMTFSPFFVQSLLVGFKRNPKKFVGHFLRSYFKFSLRARPKTYEK